MAQGEIELFSEWQDIVSYVQGKTQEPSTGEHWLIVDESVGGVRLRQKVTSTRLTHGRLVCMRPPGSERFLIGRVCWVRCQENRVIEVGIGFLGGLPKVVAIRETGASAAAKPNYHQAFFLSEMPALKQSQSLVLPSGWYASGREIELDDGDKHPVRLRRLMQHGVNFEQIQFESLFDTAAVGSLSQATLFLDDDE